MRWERHYDELGYGEELIERHGQRPGERKCDRVGTVQAKSFRLSNIGIARYFSWQGKHVGRALTTLMDSEAMTIARNVQARECVPKQLTRSKMSRKSQTQVFLHEHRTAPGRRNAGPLVRKTRRKYSGNSEFGGGDHTRRTQAPEGGGDILSGQPLNPSELENVDDNEL